MKGAPATVQAIADRLIERHWMLAVAESCTGGGLGSALTDLAGSSQWFAGGVISYSNVFKREWLGVDAGLLERVGAVSREAAEGMALGVARRGHVDASIAVTGIAGPDGGTPDKPVGLVWVATWDAERDLRSSRLSLSGDRQAIRLQAIARALDFFLQDLS